MQINHNIQALIAYSKYNTNQSQMSKTMEKLSTGLRINRAADDAAGLAVSEKMRGQIKGLQQAERNTLDGISLIQTAEGGMNELHDILQRMRELAVQAANDTYTADDRNATQLEVNELVQQIDQLATSTHYNTQNLLDQTGGRSGVFTFQIGANGGQTVDLPLPDLRSATLGVNALNLSSHQNATSALQSIDAAIASVSNERTKLGAFQNRLEKHLGMIGGSTENLTAAESRIRDANMAMEMTEFTKLNIINQSAQAMLSQANQLPQGVLQLLKS
ncbi:flagellin [Ammoniphilus sp. 3BR4]|uniref:flagellin N-terminal helical domain-containing protein n=1 Tax=Ammoniphilus sp. 3BR4 TaxID=3158265 RepID=UPI003465A614